MIYQLVMYSRKFLKMPDTQKKYSLRYCHVFVRIVSVQRRVEVPEAKCWKESF